LYWCFVDFEKAFESVHREDLWYKLRRTEISDNMVKCIKEMYLTRLSFVEKRSSLSPYLFNIFIDDIIDYVSKDNPHALEIGTTTIPGFLFAEGFAFSSFTINGLRKTIDQVTEYCRECNLKCNIN
jgi:hypothetical protein